MKRAVLFMGAAAAVFGPARSAWAEENVAGMGTDQYSLETPEATVRAYAWVKRLREDLPLIVALHGGGFSGRDYNAPGFSLVDAATKRGFGIDLLDRPGYANSHSKQRDGDCWFRTPAS